MSILNACKIQISGLSFGVHQFEFEINNDFFSSIQDSLIHKGHFHVNAVLDKKPRMLVLDLSIHGSMNTSCDRCLEAISLPLEGNQQYTFKYKTDIEEQDLDSELIFISGTEQILDISPWVHETICLVVPMIKAYDCENDPAANCNEEILNLINTQEKESNNNPIWDTLRKELKNK